MEINIIYTKEVFRIENNKDKYYPGTDTEITSPFYHTACSCGMEFLRIHPRQVVTCPRCGRKMDADEKKKAC